MFQFRHKNYSNIYDETYLEMYKGPKLETKSTKTIKRLRILFLDRCFIPRVLKGIFANYLLLRSGGCTVKREKGTLNSKNGNFSGTTTCSGNSHLFHRAPCPSGYATTIRDKLAGIEFTLATVNSSGAQFLGHGGADLAITVFRANKRKAAWFVTRYRLSFVRRCRHFDESDILRD